MRDGGRMPDSGGGGAYGRWDSDEDGAPCFRVRIGPETAALVLPDGAPGRPWHRIANGRAGADAHVDGRIDLWSTDRGLVRMGTLAPGPRWVAAQTDGCIAQACFGPGRAAWEGNVDETPFTRTVRVPGDPVPVLLIETSPHREISTPVTYTEELILEPRPVVLGGLMSRRVPPPGSASKPEKLLWETAFTASRASRLATELARTVLTAGLRLRHAGGIEGITSSALFTSPRSSSRPRPSYLPQPPACFAIALLAPEGGATLQPRISWGGWTVRIDVPFGARPPRSAVIGVSWGSRDEVGAALRDACAVTGRATCRGSEKCAPAGAMDVPEPGSGRSHRKAPIPKAPIWKAPVDLECPASPVLERECGWHAAGLASLAAHDDVIGHRFVQQGAAYTYVHGLQGAPRDYAISTIALSHVDPELAAEQIQTILYMTRADGAIEYAHTGAGKVTSAAIHATPSDLPLFLLWCLTDHVWATGDLAFLDRETRSHDGSRSSVAERAVASWRRLAARIGTGPHGLLRVGTGDWNDPISLTVRSRRAFHQDGESAYNTAMALYVLPRAAELFDGVDAAEASAMRELADRLGRALEACWTGRWFVRGWDGQGRTIGEEHLFLDANAWCLVAGAGEHEQRERLVKEIGTRCDDPSPIGATILDRPHHMRGGLLPPGWDCNGGVWAAVNAILAWGYALHDTERAWKLLHKMSFAAHADAYPNVWYGKWNGPDAFNSEMGDRPGETFVHPATPMAEWPVPNSNAHAAPLVGLLKVAGIEATPAGICVTPRVPRRALPFRLRTRLVDVRVPAKGKPMVEAGPNRRKG